MKGISALGGVAVVIAACGGGDGPCATAVGEGGRLTLALPEVCLRDGVAERRVGGVWQGGAAVQVEPVVDGAVVRLSAAGPSEGFALTLRGVDADRMLQQGYQSWGFAGAVRVPAQVEAAVDGKPAFAAAQSGDPLHEEAGVSYHAALFRRGADGPVLVIGALSGTRAITGIAAARDGDQATIQVVYGAQRDVLGAGAGGQAVSERLFLGSAATPEAALTALSAHMVAEHVGSGFTPRRPPGGWYSWNQHFDAVDAAKVRAQLPVMTARLAPAGLPLVEIDDGWEQAWGDWQDNAKFPEGMPALAQEITGQGLVAGVWLAPFLVDVNSAAAQKDAAFFVQGPDGQPLRHQISGNPRTFFVLDGSNPEAMKIVTDEITRLALSGFTYFKLDFLYAGALSGGRKQAVTGVEALRLGLGAIRAAAGPGAIINACGSPTLPVLGLADSLRVGADTAFAGFELSWSLVVSAARNLGVRAHLFPLVWPDADQTQVRLPFTAAEARTSAVIAALAGPAYALGDDLPGLPAERLDVALEATLLDLAGAAAPAIPDGLMDDPGDDIPLNPILESVRYDEGVATAPPARFHATGKSGTRYLIQVVWRGSHETTITPEP